MTEPASTPPGAAPAAAPAAAPSGADAGTHPAQTTAGGSERAAIAQALPTEPGRTMMRRLVVAGTMITSSVTALR